MILKKLKPLMPELTQVLVDRSGNFSGLRNQLPGQEPRDLKGSKAFLYAYDGEFGNFYGQAGTKISVKSGRNRCKPSSGWRNITRRLPA